jgi:hypothetical protein
MAIDQRDVSSTLRFMDDRALQQYAAMYKNDPYIFPLAFQESQNRQRLRMSQQSAQGMQPQPKVNEQALAQMAPQQLPEQMGIGALPADNMQQMADGGIAGYDDADFVSRSEPVVMMAGGGVPRYAGEDESLVEDTSSTLGNFFGDIRDYFARQSDQSQETQRRIRAANEAKRQIYEMQPGLLEQLTPTQRKEREKQINALKQPQEYVRQQDKLMAPALKTPRRQGDEFEAEEKMVADRAAKLPVAGPSVKAGPKADTKRKDTERKDPSARPAAGPSTTSQFDVESMMNTALAKAEGKTDPGEARLKELNAEKVKAGEANIAGLEAINKQFADIFKGKKDRLDTREGEIAKMDKQVLGLAAVLAGARMMQTRGSIGEAIGAGIDTGSKQYVAGLDKINAAKDKLSDARDRMEELEAQRGEMSAREMHKARNEVKAITIAGMEDLVKAAMAERKMNRTEAIAFVNAQLQTNLKLEEIRSRSADTRALIAARGDTSGTKQAKLQLDTLKAQAAAISKELADPYSMMSLPRNAALKQAKQAELASINAQMNQIAGLSTMMPPPNSEGVGGTRPPIESFQR